MKDEGRFSLAGKKALIANPEADFGPQVAEGLCEAGAEVFLCGADMASMEGIAAGLPPPGCGASALKEYFQGTEDAASGLAAWAKAEMGRVDCFVYVDPCIGLAGWEHGLDDIAGNMRVSQTGLMLTVKHIGMLMAEGGSGDGSGSRSGNGNGGRSGNGDGDGGGSMLFISDYAALVGCDVHNYDEAPEAFDEGFSLEYGFAKGGYVNYARQAAGYLGEYGVRCNCIAFAPLEGRMPAGFEKAFVRHSHLKRMASGQDVKGAAVFLASGASSYITGVTLPVDGGYTAK